MSNVNINENKHKNIQNNGQNSVFDANIQDIKKTVPQGNEPGEAVIPVHKEQVVNNVQQDLDNARADTMYFKRIMESSADQNEELALKTKELVNNEWTVIKGEKKPLFIQKLPKAKKDKKWGSTENDAVSRAKKTFRNADLCTVREMASMKKYFEDAGTKGDVKDGAKDVPGDRKLMEWVDKYLLVDINGAMFTDDYLSQNMPKMFEYARELQRIGSLKTDYPKFYASLSAEKKAIIESRSETGKDMEEVLTLHMKKHGMVMKEKNGKTSVSLWKENADKRTRHAERDTLTTNYLNKLDDFLKKTLKHSEVKIAKTYAESESFDAEKLSEDIDKEIEESGKSKEVCRPEMDAAADEMKKAYTLRDKILDEQAELIKTFSDKKLDKEEREKAERKIMINNSKIRMISRHAEHYREYLDFCLGKTERVSNETMKFLERDGHTDLAELVIQKDIFEQFNEALFLNEKLKLKKELKEKKKDIDKSIEVKDLEGNDEWGVIDLKEGKGGLFKEAKDLEEKIRSMTYVKMPADTFFDLLKKYNYPEARDKKKTLEEVRKDDVERREKAERDAKAFADKNKFKVTSGSGRCSGYLRDPYGKIINLDKMVMATHYSPTEDTPEEVKDDIIKNGLKPLLNELLAITPEKLSAMKLPKEPDIESPEYWKNRMLLNIGFDMSTFLVQLNSYNVTLTDDECARLKSFGAIAQIMYGDYGFYESTLADTSSLILKDKKIRDNILELGDKVFDIENKDPDVKEFRQKYSQDALGYQKKAFEGTKSEKFGKKQSLADFSVEMVPVLMTKVYKEDNLAADNIAEQYNDRLQKEKEIISAPLQEEIRKAKFMSDDYGENIGKLRLKIKNRNKMRDTMFTDEQVARWKKHFGTNEGGGDIRSFKNLMLPVERDANNTYDRENQLRKEQNDRDFEDYISGDEKRKNRCLYNIGKRIAKLQITPEMFEEGYLRDHYYEMYDDIMMLHGFANILEENQDFFESDAFTEEERDAIRRNYVYDGKTELILMLSSFFVQRFGVQDDGKDIHIPKEGTEEEKKNYIQGKMKDFGDQIDFILKDENDGLNARIEKQKKYDALFKEKPDDVRRASALLTEAVGTRKRLQRRLKNIDTEIASMPESAKKTKMLANIDQIKADLQQQIKDADKKIKLETNIRDHVFGYKDIELSQEEKDLFNSLERDENGKTVPLHREVLKPVSGPDENQTG
ncbi:MAG: hypothetical protein K5668_10160 [Lachnospiraceae bacterium]|nr:hypothetical protein [Lachnospiraceae bacterium]